MLVFLDRQHAGKPHKLTDRGAAADLDGDKEIGIWEREAMLTSPIATSAEATLIELGHHVIPISDGRYSERHNRVNGYAAGYHGTCVYVALHLNAGGGGYGSVFYDHRSTRGDALSKSVAASLRSHIVASGYEARAIPCKASDWTKNAYATISGVAKPIALVYEPAFIDTLEHRPLLTTAGLELLGQCLALGIHAWQ